MNKVTEFVVIFAGLAMFILLAASVPLVMRTNGDTLEFTFGQAAEVIAEYVAELAQGSLGTYMLGSTKREVAADLLPFAEKTFTLLAGSMLVGLTASILFGVIFARTRMARYIRAVLAVLSVIPDFALVLLSLLAAVGFYRLTGVRLITLSPFSEAPNLWFPMLVLALPPSLYLVKAVAARYEQISGEDFMRTALAKGLTPFHIRLHHVLKNVIPFLKADLKKAIAVAMTSLFVVEYTLNVVGVTRFIFSGYQFTAVVAGLFALMVISLLVYGLMLLLLHLLERGVLYE